MPIGFIAFIFMEFNNILPLVRRGNQPDQKNQQLKAWICCLDPKSKHELEM